ncbi:MAG TPA: hypothetical protein VFO96_13535 [Gemmatimonadales bacterium]|jgi:hypothetical protein|nr:hypothetical protein [Gemmatimonadales bacterium]
MTTLRRIAPALTLLLIAPLVAEFLLGDFNIRQIGFIAVFIPVYGAGALLVREVTRRAHRGWPTMLLLALAYALVMEGFANQTLFNPNYAGQRLLDYGWISSLGTSLNWTVYVLTLHVVWSVGSSVALAEALAGARWREPWLRRPGLIVTVILTLIGIAFTASFALRTFHFVASPAQFAGVAIVTVAAIVAAFRLFRRDRSAESASGTNRAPSVWLVLVAALILASAFQRWFGYAPKHEINAGLGLAVLLGLEIVAVVLFVTLARREGWGPVHVLAAATGAVLTYGWISIRRLVVAGGTSLGVPTTPIDVVGQVALLLAMLAVSYVGWKRLSAVSCEL